MFERPLQSARALVAAALVLALVAAACVQSVAADDHVDARISSSEPFTWDPARAGDAGSAGVLAQVYEGLTAFDAESKVQPALAAAWQASDDGRQLTFQLRPGLTYSDGSPILAQHVVESWLRLIDPTQPSPLSSLLADVVGATDYTAGRIGADGVGLHADGDRVIVDLHRPATYFLSVTASPSLAVVPPSARNEIANGPPQTVSGAYLPTTTEPGVIRMSANPNYWAGVPALDEIELVTDFGGRGGVDLFTAGEIDYTGIGGADASWIRYDATLGEQLRQTNNFSVSYYGFSTTVAPFDEPSVRLALAKAVDWQHMVALAGGPPATSMIPPGVPGHDELDHRPAFDPQAARDLLAAAGYPGGAGFPHVTLVTYGVGFEQTVATELETNLGISVDVEGYDFQGYLEGVGLGSRPEIWTLSWIADYPHAHDFLGLLLESGSTTNPGRWSNAEYDALIAQAAATADPIEQAGFYTLAQDILAREAPVVPLAYDESWALSRTGLLGAQVSGVGILRLAGLDWAPGTGR